MTQCIYVFVFYCLSKINHRRTVQFYSDVVAVVIATVAVASTRVLRAAVGDSSRIDAPTLIQKPGAACTVVYETLRAATERGAV